MVEFDMLGMTSCSCAIVTLSLRRAVFQIFGYKLCHDLEIWVRGQSRLLKLIFDISCMVSFYCPIITLSLTCTIF